MNAIVAPPDATIGFVGLGLMGAPMAARLLEAGFRLCIYCRDPGKGGDLVSRGATRMSSVAELCGHADAVISMVGDPHDVRTLYVDDGGIIVSSRPGTYLVDMTTSTPELARQIFTAASRRALNALDAPVSGGQVGAQSGRLTIMVGGEKEAFAALRPVFSAMGANVEHFGPAGAGQTTKMCNQIAVAGILVGIAEAMACAKASDVDPMAILNALRASTAGSVLLERVGPKMLTDDREASFYIRHFIKDLTIAMDESQGMGLQLRGADLARDLYAGVAREGGGEQGIQALIGAYPQHRRGDARG